MRSATAKNILKAAGYENVINAGSWMALNSKL
jgi:rhodanese-related sulfurtransferase